MLPLHSTVISILLHLDCVILAMQMNGFGRVQVSFFCFCVWIRFHIPFPVCGGLILQPLDFCITACPFPFTHIGVTVYCITHAGFC